MKKVILVLASLVSTTISYGQTDTIFTNNEIILCKVTEITTDAVKYSLNEEDLINALYKNAVQKIVFKNGREQRFSEATLFKKIENVRDYEKVSLSQLEGEVKGLFKLGEVSAKAEGGTTLSNQERVKERAYRKLKIQAAMQGANVVFLTHQRTQGNNSGGFFISSTPAETNLSGIAYTNELPSFNAFEKVVSDKRNFTTTKESVLWSDMATVFHQNRKRAFTINSLYSEQGLIMIEGRLEGIPKKYSKFRVVNFTKDSFTLFYEDKTAVYNLVVPL